MTNCIRQHLRLVPSLESRSGTRSALKMVPRAAVGEAYVTNFVAKGVFDLLLRASQASGRSEGKIGRLWKLSHPEHRPTYPQPVK